MGMISFRIYRGINCSSKQKEGWTTHLGALIRGRFDQIRYIVIKIASPCSRSPSASIRL